MKNYDRVHATKPAGIENKKAYIVGGGIAGLSAAAFLIEDAYMTPSNVTIYEQRHQNGGSMDASGISLAWSPRWRTPTAQFWMRRANATKICGSTRNTA